MNCFTSWLKEWAILHVSLQGSKNEAYFVYAALVWGKVYHKTSNSDGHGWTPLDSHGSHRIPFDIGKIATHPLGSLLSQRKFISKSRADEPSFSTIKWLQMFCYTHLKTFKLHWTEFNCLTKLSKMPGYLSLNIVDKYWRISFGQMEATVHTIMKNNW